MSDLPLKVFIFHQEVLIHELELKKEPLILGRSSKADIRVQDKGLGRKHLEISAQGQELFIRDLKSTNGTWVNGQKILAETEIGLSPSDEVRLGKGTKIKWSFPLQTGQGTVSEKGLNLPDDPTQESIEASLNFRPKMERHLTTAEKAVRQEASILKCREKAKQKKKKELKEGTVSKVTVERILRQENAPKPSDDNIESSGVRQAEAWARERSLIRKKNRSNFLKFSFLLITLGAGYLFTFQKEKTLSFVKGLLNELQGPSIEKIQRTSLDSIRKSPLCSTPEEKALCQSLQLRSPDGVQISKDLKETLFITMDFSKALTLSTFKKLTSPQRVLTQLKALDKGINPAFLAQAQNLGLKNLKILVFLQHEQDFALALLLEIKMNKWTQSSFQSLNSALNLPGATPQQEKFYIQSVRPLISKVSFPQD